jgi:hypothetical protein
MKSLLLIILSLLLCSPIYSRTATVDKKKYSDRRIVLDNDKNIIFTIDKNGVVRNNNDKIIFYFDEYGNVKNSFKKLIYYIGFEGTVYDINKHTLGKLDVDRGWIYDDNMSPIGALSFNTVFQMNGGRREKIAFIENAYIDDNTIINYERICATIFFLLQ